MNETIIQNDFDLQEKFIRLYDLDFSDVEELIKKEEIILIGCRYKHAGIENAEYIFIDKNMDYIYTIWEYFLNKSLRDSLRSGMNQSEVSILSGDLTEYEFNRLTKYCLDKILPLTKLVDINGKDKTNYLNRNMEVNYKDSCVIKMNDIFNNNFMKKSNNVNIYSLIKNKELKIPYIEKAKQVSSKILTHKGSYVVLGICIAKTIL